MVKVTLFSDENGQIVNLPKSVVLPVGVKKVDIIKQGKSRLIIPEDAVLDSFFEGTTVTDDFVIERNQLGMSHCSRVLTL